MSDLPSHWAPIALFIFKRPEHTRRMIEHLQRCPGFEDSPVFVFADGPRDAGDVAAVQEARSEARRLLGDRAVFRENESNVGLDRSEIAAVTELCASFGRVVVVEDDLVVSPYFLEFLNEGLRRYGGEPRVMEVCGFIFDVPALQGSSDAFFLPVSSAWGWATWKRAWDLFDPEAPGWSERLSDPEQRRRFNLDGNVDYTRLLSRQMRKSVPAWDICWYYNVFSHDGLALHPPQTLVRNEGFDGSGTHLRLSLPARQGELSPNELNFPTEIACTPLTEAVFRAYGEFRSASIPQKVLALARATLMPRGRR